jgi:hypothetical protein
MVAQPIKAKTAFVKQSLFGICSSAPTRQILACEKKMKKGLIFSLMAEK